jgi:hypothetical protein
MKKGARSAGQAESGLPLPELFFCQAAPEFLLIFFCFSCPWFIHGNFLCVDFKISGSIIHASE